MALTSTPVQDRRRFTRGDPSGRFEVNFLRPSGLISAESVNISEGGLCVRLEQMLEVRSLVQLQLTPSSARARLPAPRQRAGQAGRPVRCTGRVTWVMQRLDLRTSPPFLFDAGIELINPPPLLRQLSMPRGEAAVAKRRPATHHKTLESAVIRGREFNPRLERAPGQAGRWHLVVSVDGVPCFSEHYPSERTATAAWARFKRRQARR